MSNDLTEKKEFKKRLTTLKAKRIEIIKKNQESLKVQRKEITLIKKELINRDCTVPELTSLTGLDSEKVFYYISALIKFGEIEAVEKKTGYFLYHLKGNNKNRKPTMTPKQSE